MSVLATTSSLAEGPTQPPVKWVPGAVSTGIKQLGHETDWTTPFSVEVKKIGAIPPLPICRHGVLS
jgi:hypothetical protein